MAGILFLVIAATSGLAQAPVTEGLVNRWPGNGSAADASGHDDGKISGGVRYGQAPTGKAFQFNGADAMVQFASASANFGKRDFTIAFWIKTASTRPAEAFVEKRVSCDASAPFWSLRLGGGVINGVPMPAGYIGLEVNAGGFDGLVSNFPDKTPRLEPLDNGHPNASIGLYSTRAINDGVWHHLAYVRQSTSSGTTIYLLYMDGTVENSLTVTLTADLHNSSAVVMGQTVCGSGDGTRPFSGAARELQLFNRAISAEEAAAIYNAGKSGK